MWPPGSPSKPRTSCSNMRTPEAAATRDGTGRRHGPDALQARRGAGRRFGLGSRPPGGSGCRAQRVEDTAGEPCDSRSIPGEPSPTSSSKSDDGGLRMYKAQTTPDDPVAGVLETLAHAAEDLGESRDALLGRGEMLIHGTTHAINAIVTGNTARTAFLTTRGHPDVLVFREGGRIEPFNFTVPYPEPYVPRSLTYEVPERVAYDGSVTEALDESAVVGIVEELKRQEIEAVGVCLLWSIVNPCARAPCRRAARAPPAGRALHPLARAQPLAAGISPRVVHLHRRLAQAAHGRLSGRVGSAPARRRLRRPCPGGHHPGRRHGCGRHGARADPLDQLGPGHGAHRRACLRRRRHRRRHRHRRRYRRHHLRREPGARGAHTLDPRNLDRPALPRPHDRLPGGGREEHRRRGRQHRLGRRGRPAPCRAEERRRRSRPRSATGREAPSPP